MVEPHARHTLEVGELLDDSMVRDAAPTLFSASFGDPCVGRQRRCSHFIVPFRAGARDMSALLLCEGAYPPRRGVLRGNGVAVYYLSDI